MPNVLSCAIWPSGSCACVILSNRESLQIHGRNSGGWVKVNKRLRELIVAAQIDQASLTAFRQSIGEAGPGYMRQGLAHAFRLV
jgi:hypothetical protein